MTAKYDTATLAVLRRALDDVLLDHRFLRSRSVSALEMTEHLLSLAAKGERSEQRLKQSALRMLDRAVRKNAA
jgi:hypothetical protein